jgi:DNA-binding response OmpR family regulator
MAPNEGVARAGMPSLIRDGVGLLDVLIVHDDVVLGGLLTRVLSGHGLRTRRLADSDEATRRLLGGTPPARVVLLDIGLPGLDGPSVLRAMADQGVLERTRIIVVTGRAAEHGRLPELALGAFDHLAKPLSVPVLVPRICRALAPRGHDPGNTRIPPFT